MIGNIFSYNHLLLPDIEIMLLLTIQLRCFRITTEIGIWSLQKEFDIDDSSTLIVAYFNVLILF